MKVKTLRRHDNEYGDKYEKFLGKIYEHPNPVRLIADGVVEAVDVQADDVDVSD